MYTDETEHEDLTGERDLQALLTLASWLFKCRFQCLPDWLELVALKSALPF